VSEQFLNGTSAQFYIKSSKAVPVWTLLLTPLGKHNAPESDLMVFSDGKRIAKTIFCSFC